MLNHQVDFQVWNKNKFKWCFNNKSFRNPNPSSCGFKNTFKEARLSLRHSYDSVGFSTQKSFKTRGIEDRDDSEPKKTNLVTHNWCKIGHVYEMKYTRELEKKRSLDSLLMSLQLQITITLFLFLSLSLTYFWTELQK